MLVLIEINKYNNVKEFNIRMKMKMKKKMMVTNRMLMMMMMMKIIINSSNNNIHTNKNNNNSNNQHSIIRDRRYSPSSKTLSNTLISWCWSQMNVCTQS